MNDHTSTGSDLTKTANERAKGPAPYNKPRLDQTLDKKEAYKAKRAAEIKQAAASGHNAEIVPFPGN